MPITISKTTLKSSRFIWVFTCMYIYMYICAHVLQTYYAYAYTDMNVDDSSSKWNNNSAKYIALFKKIEFQKLTRVLDRKFTL